MREPNKYLIYRQTPSFFDVFCGRSKIKSFLTFSVNKLDLPQVDRYNMLCREAAEGATKSGVLNKQDEGLFRKSINKPALGTHHILYYKAVPSKIPS